MTVEQGRQFASEVDLSIIGELKDRAEIHDLILRYWKGVRENDAEKIASVFTEDGVLDFPLGKVAGNAAIVEYFTKRLGPHKAKNRGLEALLAVMPVVTNMLIEVTGDQATCECTVLSTALGIRAGVTEVGLEGGGSMDDLVRTDQGWRIKSRKKIGIWSMDLTGTSHLKAE